MDKMIFDLSPEKCSACCACVLACMDQNDIDATNKQHPFRNAAALEFGAGNTAQFSYLSIACMHCQDAPCIVGCPVGCLYKDEETGLTLYDNTNCIGCHSCSMACPFGAPSFNAEGKMVKCNGCIERLRVGLTPACVRVCPTGALTCTAEAQQEKNKTDQTLHQIAQQIVKGLV